MDERPRYKRTPKPPKLPRQQHFVTNLRWAVDRLGLTLRALAEKAGIEEQWVRRAATQGIAWPKKSGREAIDKLEAYLGCPTNTLWDEDGHGFREGVTRKHLRGREPVTDFETVYRRFENDPPPLLLAALEIIDYLRLSLDDPSAEPPRLVELLGSRGSGTVTWQPSEGWSIPDSVIERWIEGARDDALQLESIGVPGAGEISIQREDIDRAARLCDPSQIPFFALVTSYAEKAGMRVQEALRLFRLKDSEHEQQVAEDERRKTEEAERESARLTAEWDAAKQAAAKQAASLLDGLPEAVRDWHMDILPRSRVLAEFEEVIFNRSTGWLSGKQESIDKIVTEIRDRLLRQYEHEMSRRSHRLEDEDEDLSDGLYTSERQMEIDSDDAWEELRSSMDHDDGDLGLDD